VAAANALYFLYRFVARKKLNKLVIKSFLGPFALIFFLVLFLLLMQFLWRYIDDLVGKGLGLGIIGELLLYTSASLVPLALPLSILMSSLMTFGNMGEYNELTALKSSGISLQRIMQPLIIVVLFISIGAFFFSNNVLPYTNLKMRSLLYDVRQQRPDIQINPGEFYSGIENYSIRVGKRNPETNVLYDIKIYDHTTRKGNNCVTMADSGYMKMTADKSNLIITLWSGMSYTELGDDRRKRAKTYPHRLDKFKEQRLILKLTGFGLQRTDENLFRSNYQMMNLAQLNKAKDSLRKELEFRDEQFYKTLMVQNYFRVRHSPRRRELERREEAARDSSINQQNILPEKINIDTLFSTLSLRERGRIISEALSYARSSKSYIENTAENLKYKNRHLRKHEIEWHRKFTLSFACLVFLFIGAPLGAIIRKGGIGMPTVISTFMFIVYYVISLMGEKIVRESVLTAAEGMWMSSFVLLVIGGFLTYKATTDSAILNVDTYILFFRRALGIDKLQMLDIKSNLTGKFGFTVVEIEDMKEALQQLGKSTGIYKSDIDNAIKIKNSLVLYMTSGNIQHLEEFEGMYNKTIDRLITSNWFKIIYIQQKVNEFPVIDFAKYRLVHSLIFRLFTYLIFPLVLFNFTRYYISLFKLRRQLIAVTNITQSIIDIFNNPSLLVELEIEQ
jgi:lipopolysaccharide export system permease protein